MNIHVLNNSISADRLFTNNLKITHNEAVEVPKLLQAVFYVSFACLRQSWPETSYTHRLQSTMPGTSHLREVHV